MSSESSLAKQHGLGGLLSQMHVQTRSARVHPDTFAGGHRNLRRLANDDEIARLDSRQQVSDVHMGVALCAHLDSIVGEPPPVSPDTFRLLDGGGPQLRSVGGTHLVQFMVRDSMGAG